MTLTIDTPLKWTTEDGKSCHGGKHDWVKYPSLQVFGQLKPCENGIHLASISQAIQYRWLSNGVWQVNQLRGKQIELDDKTVVRACRVIRRLPWNRRLVVLWACDCAERVTQKLIGTQAIEAARRWTCDLATIDEVRTAANAADAYFAYAAANAAYAAYYAANGANAAAYAAYAAARAAANGANAASYAAYAANAAANAAYAAYHAANAANGANAAAYAAYAAACAADERQWQANRLLDYLKGRLPAPAEPYRHILMSEI